MALSKVGVSKAEKIRTAAALGLGAAVLLAGCGTDSDTPVAKKTSAAPATSASPSADPEQQAREQVLAAYRGMWAEQVKIYGSGSFKGSQLEKYAADKALAKVRAAAFYYQNNDLVVKGKPKLEDDPKVTLSLGGASKSAVIVDCVDSTNFVPENRKTGEKSELDSTSRRKVQTSKAQYSSGRWMITDSTIDKGSTC
ncbi:hypothetical protein ACFFSH_29640 [Streptomyces filamentosus]|uniref:Secreted protein/lipoprotein n=1 Tax=Streptomyces filamentosus TaxID=67294 RepID=A0A919ERB1_STRFL|nr:hypothetical protein [Streptomyces filamentosus]GHG12628.1 hypothetical protein GCM10017667_52630 [Streptomyces filamentosus]